MDSVTQIVLGAAVGEVVLGKKIGNKAQLMGAIAGTIPDLDVFFSIGAHDAIEAMRIHRSYSHAIFTHIWLAIPFTWISFYLLKKKVAWWPQYWLWFLGFATHALLDCCTTYGTQFLLPFTRYLVGFNNISIIDPLYTLPFMILLIVCLYKKHDDPFRIKYAWTAIAYSMFYMGLTCWAKWEAHQHVVATLEKKQVQVEQVSTSPTIFNAVLWAGMAYNDSVMYVGEYSIFQHHEDADLAAFPRHLEYEKGFEGNHLDIFKWFSQGKYILEKSGPDTLNMYICKWGRMDYKSNDARTCFKFYFKLVKTEQGILAYQEEPHFTGEEIKTALKEMYRRTFI